MKKLLAVGLVVISAIVVYFVAVAAMDNLDGLGGEAWEVVAIEENGKKVPVEGFAGMRVQFAKNKVTWTVPDRKGQLIEMDGAFRHDPTKKPKEIDLSLPGDPDPAPGIYELKDDTLIICMGVRRPTEISSRGQMVWVLKR